MTDPRLNVRMAKFTVAVLSGHDSAPLLFLLAPVDISVLDRFEQRCTFGNLSVFVTRVTQECFSLVAGTACS
jgi:hypothetical protein